MFGNQTGSGPGGAIGGGELLFGSGAFGRQGSSGSEGAVPQAAGIGSGPSSFDLSQDFPSLGRAAPGAGLQGGAGLAAALRQQQQQQQQQHMLQQQMLSGVDAGNNYRIATEGQGNVNMAAEDFPALGRSGVAPQKSSSSPFLGSAQAVSRTPSNTNGPDDAIGGSGGGGSNPLFNGLSGGFAGLSIGGGVGPSSQAQRGNNPAAPSTSSDGAGSAIHSDYGLLGLLSVIRMTDADRNALALGSDLQSLGLNVKSSDKLYDTFGSPFVDTPVTREPSYHVSTSMRNGCLLCGARHVSCGRWWCHFTPFSFVLTVIHLLSSLLPTTDTHMLLYEPTRIENRTPFKVHHRNSLLRLLRHAEGRSAGLRRTGAVLAAVEVPRGAEALVQAGRAW